LIQARVFEGVKISLELDREIEVRGRVGDLGHVFLNLIDNAVRAAEPRGTVHVRLRGAQHLAVIEVGDSGSGIAPERREEVFAPFFTTRAAGEGTGLGLAVARQVVLQHGGQIEVGKSELGGALMTVTLPLGPPADEQTTSDQSLGSGGGAAGFANR
jgi:signal transduction histidine kinase